MKKLITVLSWMLLMGSLLVAGCSTHSLNRAPVEDRAGVVGQPAPEVAPPRVLPGVENVGRVGYYTVKPGDTLTRIALESGQSPRDLVTWNQLENPNRIEVGQVLRVVPGGESEVQVKPVTKSVVTAVSTTPLPTQSASTPVAAPVEAPAAAASHPVPAETGIVWIWPSQGSVLTPFNELKNKGVDIGGVAGDPVLAAADGRVVYVGAGLRGYGNLIILKHDNVFLSAYAHNRTLLVKEDQSVLKGQKIAEMGNSDTDRVKLHFEVRRQGKPVDPLKYLPAR
jgi:lipoprotein NlpD